MRTAESTGVKARRDASTDEHNPRRGAKRPVRACTCCFHKRVESERQQGAEHALGRRPMGRTRAYGDEAIAARAFGHQTRAVAAALQPPLDTLAPSRGLPERARATSVNPWGFSVAQERQLWRFLKLSVLHDGHFQSLGS